MTFKEHFEQQGFLHLSNFVDRSMIRHIKQQYLQTVKPFDQPLLRQSTDQYETHLFSEDGFMTNPLLNIHESLPEALIGFRSSVVDLLGHDALQQLLKKLMGERPVLVQSMYAESSQGSPDHIDSHLIDSARTGSMIGCWVALEDIDANGGRFTLFPKSHLLDNTQVFSEEVTHLYQQYNALAIQAINAYPGGQPQVATQAQQVLEKLLKASNLSRYNQDIQAGDVFLFSSKLIQGNEKPTHRQSHHSVVAHFVPAVYPLRHHSTHNVDLRIAQGGNLAIHIAPEAVMA
ncbi:phytanoyl-CoA dioxygenase family protein [Microscilla marina]|uniref:Phytanoyl-CoA dioxygenase (PhyH) superfamily n=1 Tax=Microscilla marina ATCC 23134 TaxID=313606 RepID=A1ZRG0_MICM2|nr:phytanoyl-CoA dioxygenase family protein [Microscilla marina]EAY27050.1 phytanoyl-CoA dioxygenase (PhyH) superfamily [Microscilla marina ATCC 23134]